ncbi:MAG: carbohydrate kinase [Actinomycetales bacterium]|nr:carbohydrate kinase [Actinomycetales bacterium]
MTTQRALVVGEALIDVVHRRDGSVESHPGGSPLNVAIGLARLGREAHLLTWFADDDGGTALRSHLAGSGVHVASGSDGAQRTTTATATLDEHGAATYEFDVDWQLPGAPVSLDPVVVHTGSIAAVLEPGASAVLALVQAHRESASVTYDPNMRPALMGSPAQAAQRVEPMLEVADVIKVSDEDLEWYAPGRDLVEVAREWASRGPAVVVVTLGGSGAFAVTSSGLRVDVVAPKVDVADTVGAGDSFMGGLVDGLWSADLLGATRREALHRVDEATLRGVLERCVRIAAITVSRPGANPPTAAELD